MLFAKARTFDLLSVIRLIHSHFAVEHIP
jgi:hypothetical protein